MQAYSDITRESDPDVEVFYRTQAACDADEWSAGEGWYWWLCIPGCLPDSDAIGPFANEAAALADALSYGASSLA